MLVGSRVWLATPGPAFRISLVSKPGLDENARFGDQRGVLNAEPGVASQTLDMDLLMPAGLVDQKGSTERLSAAGGKKRLSAAGGKKYFGRV